jgi:CRP-like cAMP-binding protein
MLLPVIESGRKAVKRQDPKIALLRKVPGLAGYADRQLAQLTPLVDEADVPAGTILVEEGKPGRQTFLVVEGEADVTLRGQYLERVGPGGFIGEMALLDASPRSATVTAVTDMKVLVMDPTSFSSLLAQPAVSRRIASELAGRLRRAEGAPTYEAVRVAR